jgi:hypothetical protein
MVRYDFRQRYQSAAAALQALTVPTTVASKTTIVPKTTVIAPTKPQAAYPVTSPPVGKVAPSHLELPPIHPFETPSPTSRMILQVVMFCLGIAIVFTLATLNRPARVRQATQPTPTASTTNNPTATIEPTESPSPQPTVTELPVASPTFSPQVNDSPTPFQSESPQPVPNPADTPTSAEQLATQLERFEAIVNRATAAAQSREEWELIVGQYEIMISSLKTLPASSPDYALAQQKIQEYDQKLTTAKQQSSR